MAIVVVAGTTNGGSTMITGILEILGFNMGKGNWGYGNTKEDVSIWNLFYSDKLAGEIELRNEQYENWGFKNPGGWKRIDELIEQIGLPKIIMIYRDPVALARSGNLKGRQGILTSAKMNAEAAQTMRRIPHLALSYEKALLFPERTVAQLVEYLGLEPSAKQIEEAVKYVQPERGHG